MRLREFKEDEWHTFWGMISAAVADLPDVLKGIPDLGSKCSAVIGTIDAGITIWKTVSEHKAFHDAVKRKIYQHVPVAIDCSVNAISKAIFKYLKQTKNSHKNIAYYYQNKKDEDFAEELFKVCVRVIPANTVPESELRFFLGEVAKIILDPENAVLLTEDEEILKGLLTSVRNLNGSLAQVQDAQHALKGELDQFLDNYSELAVEVYELTAEFGWIKRDMSQLRDDVDTLKEDVAVLKGASSSSETMQPDNQDYLEHFYDPLFLEDDDSKSVSTR